MNADGEIFDVKPGDAIPANAVPVGGYPVPGCKNCFGRGYIRTLIENVRIVQPCACLGRGDQFAAKAAYLKARHIPPHIEIKRSRLAIDEQIEKLQSGINILKQIAVDIDFRFGQPTIEKRPVSSAELIRIKEATVQKGRPLTEDEIADVLSG